MLNGLEKLHGTGFNLLSHAHKGKYIH